MFYQSDVMVKGVIKMANEKITANIGFEKKIWDAACVLRGNMDASEYKSVVLGLIFLKLHQLLFKELLIECLMGMLLLMKKIV